MVSEMQIKTGGIAGELLDEMKRRGWQLLASPLKTESKIIDNEIKVDVTWSSVFAKNGEAQSQEAWNAEMKQIAIEKGFIAS